MFQLMLMLIGILIVILLSVFYKYHRNNDLKTVQKEGLSDIKNLRLMLILLQQHRDLVAAYIAGQTELRSTISEVQTSTDQLIKQILKNNKDIVTNELWFSVNEHWQRLSQKYGKYSLDNNAIQHSSMIQNLLYLIDDIAISHQVHSFKVSDIKNTRLIWKEWLTVIECVSQARTMGSAILSEGECSHVARIRLSYLQDKITEITERAWRGIPVSGEEKRLVNRLLACIKIEILSAADTQTLSLESSEYAAYCTEIIDTYYQRFDNMMEQFYVASERT